MWSVFLLYKSDDHMGSNQSRSIRRNRWEFSFHELRTELDTVVQRNSLVECVVRNDAVGSPDVLHVGEGNAESRRELHNLRLHGGGDRQDLEEPEAKLTPT